MTALGSPSHGRLETLHGRLLILEDLDERQDLAEVQRVLDPVPRAEQLDGGAELVGQLPAGHQFSHTAAVHSFHAREVQEDLPPPLCNELADHLAEHLVAILSNEISSEVNDDHITNVADVRFHGVIVVPFGVALAVAHTARGHLPAGPLPLGVDPLEPANDGSKLDGKGRPHVRRSEGSRVEQLDVAVPGPQGVITATNRGSEWFARHLRLGAPGCVQGCMVFMDNALANNAFSCTSIDAPRPCQAAQDGRADDRGRGLRLGEG